MELCNTATTRADSSFGVPVQILQPSASLEHLGQADLDGDSPNISRDGFLWTEALRTAMQTPDLRQDRIASLKARIASGEYEIDDMALAEALVHEDGAIFAL